MLLLYSVRTCPSACPSLRLKNMQLIIFCSSFSVAVHINLSSGNTSQSNAVTSCCCSCHQQTATSKVNAVHLLVTIYVDFRSLFLKGFSKWQHSLKASEENVRLMIQFHLYLPHYPTAKINDSISFIFTPLSNSQDQFVFAQTFLEFGLQSLPTSKSQLVYAAPVLWNEIFKDFWSSPILHFQL